MPGLHSSRLLYSCSKESLSHGAYGIATAMNIKSNHTAACILVCDINGEALSGTKYGRARESNQYRPGTVRRMTTGLFPSKDATSQEVISQVIDSPSQNEHEPLGEGGFSMEADVLVRRTQVVRPTDKSAVKLPDIRLGFLRYLDKRPTTGQYDAGAAMTCMADSSSKRAPFVGGSRR